MNRITLSTLVGSTLALAAFALGPAVHAAFAPPPPLLAVEQVQPEVDGDLVYATLAAPTQTEASKAKLSIDLYLRNLEAGVRTVDRVALSFPGTVLTPIDLDAGLQMLCPWSSSGSPTSTLDLAPNQLCRLALMPDPKLALPAPSEIAIHVYLTGSPMPVTVYRSLAAHANSTATGAYRFPAKVADLPAGTFWSGRSHSGASSHHRIESPRSQVFAYDMGLARFDTATNNWEAYEAPEPGEPDPNDTNDDYLAWGVPVYAMADGEVKACAMNNVDHAPGTPANLQSNPNFLTIEHGDERAWYGHLQAGSIDAGICFSGALVSEGQYLGRVGNTGSSSAPHLHIDVSRGGVGVPLAFNDIHLVERDLNFPNQPNGNAPWSAVGGAALPEEKIVVWPSGLRRRDDITGVAVEAMRLVPSSGSRKVSYGRDAADNLRVDLWSLDSNADLTHRATDPGGALAETADSFSAAQPLGTNDAVVAVQTAAGNLKLIAYDVTSSALSRFDEHDDNPILGVAAAPAPYEKGVVTAVRTQFGNLKVIAWHADATTDTLARRDDDAGGSAQTVSVARLQGFEGVVTAVRTGTDTLRLSSFEVDLFGFLVDHEDDLEYNVSINDVEVSWVGLRDNGHDLVVTAAETQAGNMLLTAWDVDAGGFISRLSSVVVGPASDVAVARADDDHVVTALTDSSGNLKLIGWYISPLGVPERRGDSQGGEATGAALVDAAPYTTIPGLPDFMVSAVRQSNGALKLLTWQLNLTE